MKYIDREMAIEICDWYEHTFAECEYAIRPIADDLKKLPVADVQPVHHGHWIIPRFGADARCSVCGFYFTDAYDMENEDNYCRHCGARMDGEQNE